MPIAFSNKYDSDVFVRINKTDTRNMRGIANIEKNDLFCIVQSHGHRIPSTPYDIYTNKTQGRNRK